MQHSQDAKHVCLDWPRREQHLSVPVTVKCCKWTGALRVNSFAGCNQV